MRNTLLFISFFLVCKVGFPQNDNFKQMRLFEKLWGKIDKNYPSFELKGIDWQEMHDYIQPKIAPGLTQEQLMDTISLMLGPLNDGHVGVLKLKLFPLRVPYHFSAERQSQFLSEFPTDSLRNELFSTTNSTLQSYGFQELKPGYHNDNSIIDFTKSGSLGYLHISNMERVSVRKAKKKMENVITELAGSKGLIIDIRANNGGLDKISDLITSFFIDTASIARYEQERKKGSHNSFTKPKKIIINPQDLTYTHKIIILTNDRTRSAGEYPVLALQGLPYVQVVGDRTEGILGGSKLGVLPYGWVYGVNKWKVTSNNHIWYEDTGIPPDYRIQNKITDIEDKSDPLIEKAIELIYNENFSYTD